MEATNGSRASETPSSSSSDFYQAEPRVSLPDPEQKTENTTTYIQDGEDIGDSSSEMDVSVSSRSASPEPETQLAHQPNGKRKLSDSVEGPVCSADGPGEPSKKIKLSRSPPAESSLRQPQPVNGSAERPVHAPVEVWQHVFLYLSPAMLSRCLRVSRTFNTYLTRSKAEPGVLKKNQRKLRVLDSESIWSHARKTYFPNLPRPLTRCSEMQMLQLVGGITCQFCNREPSPSPATTVFNCGPGPDGLRVMWPFGIRACGHCIENTTIKDVQILVSTAAGLRSGLPYIFMTPDQHFVPEIQRQMPLGIPQSLRVAKMYYNQDIQAIQAEFTDAQSFGDGAAEEWRKGLHQKGKEAMADAARWEKWESQLRLGSDLPQVLREYDLLSFSRYHAQTQGIPAKVDVPHVVWTNGAKGGPQQQPVQVTYSLPQPVQASQNGYEQAYPAPQTPYQAAHRPVRNPYEVEEARQARRAEIERRCKELEPPLSPGVLQHMESFQAAMQITQPLNDAAWQMLKPRILAQREDAELAEHQRATQLAALQAAIPLTAAEESFMKPAKETYDKEYEHAQEPLRKKLGEYADGYIKSQWNGAHALDKDSSPEFAVRTMLHVRQRYLEDKQAGAIPSSPSVTTESRESRRTTPIPEPFLSLDNMKWMYDNKIRPLTDNHRRELFICSGCPDERRPKWFAFEGLVQHYGAKHTTAFSKGNIVVHWQTSDWPDYPPFHGEPMRFVKIEQRTFNGRAHGRARNTPQANRDGPFATPGNGRLLSDSPFFSSNAQQSSPGSNGYYSAAPGYPSQANTQFQQYGQAYPTAAQTEPAIDTSEHGRLSKFSADAREVWDGLDGVNELRRFECIRIQAVLHHAVSRYREAYHQQAHLDLITDALASNPEMRPVREAQGLACKICVAAKNDGSNSYRSYYKRVASAPRLYNISSLISHFKIVHQQEHAGHLDWMQDMIELPETELISTMIRAPGMDDDKLAIIAGAFPDAFPNPLPRIGVVEEPPQEPTRPAPDNSLATRLLDGLTKKPKGPRKKGQGNGVGTPGRETSEPLPEPKEDEYDPRRPMYVQSVEQAADPARFDTDIARKASAAPPSQNAGTSNLPPETMTFLNNLKALNAQNQQTGNGNRTERSPSVGHAEPEAAPPAKPRDNAAKVAPDIAAILASLTGQPPAQTVTPPGTYSRSGSAPKQPPADPYGQPRHQFAQYSPPTYLNDGRPAPFYQAPPAYSPSAASSAALPARYDGQDLQASFTQSARHYEQNRAQSYAGSPYTPHQRATSQHQYIYEEPQQHSPQQHPPIYREGPVQYIQVPQEYERPAPTAYQYERAAPAPASRTKPMYVDEYGRQIQLIPIDAAPAPVQYVPHPMEQQQAHQQQYVRAPYAAHAQGQASPYEDRRQPVYYEQAGPSPTAGGYGVPQTRYVYDDGAPHSSVPRS